MRFSVGAGNPARQRTGCVVAGVYESRILSAWAMRLDTASRHALRDVVKRGDFDGKLGTTLLLHDIPNVACDRVLLVGLGLEREFTETSYRTALCSAVRALARTAATQATICLDELAVKGRDGAWKIEQAVLAVMEGMYRFDRLKSKRTGTKRALKSVAFAVANRPEPVATKAAIDRGVAIAEGITLARDLGNLPGNICTPSYLAGQARELARRHGFKVTVLEPDGIARLGMNAFLAVARGSREPARLIVMEYRGGARDARPVALVGKGVTFDAGGISLKPALEMDEMKFDMCGAASVFGALHASALMKLPINIVGIVAAAENMPDGNAIKPGDIVTTMSGQTVEVLDTDVEGRLTLCDALTYAKRFKPAAVVDIATLTGEIVVALGHVASGLFSNNDALAREVLQAAEAAWDRAWRMPLWDDYQDELESNFADFPNIASHDADAITAACFLSRFTGRVPWAHLDIAGTASKSGDDKGATGRPVALLTHFLAARCAR